MSIPTCCSPHSIGIEEFQMQKSFSAASRNTNFACSISELERFPIMHHDIPAREPKLASAPNGSLLCSNFHRQLEDLVEIPESFTGNSQCQENMQDTEEHLPILASAPRAPNPWPKFRCEACKDDLDSVQIAQRTQVTVVHENMNQVKSLEKLAISRKRLKQLTIQWVLVTTPVHAHLCDFEHETKLLASAPQAPSGCPFFPSPNSDFASFPGKLDQIDGCTEIVHGYDVVMKAK